MTDTAEQLCERMGGLLNLRLYQRITVGGDLHGAADPLFPPCDAVPDQRESGGDLGATQAVATGPAERGVNRALSPRPLLHGGGPCEGASPNRIRMSRG